jgi:D-alanyl-D-alanine carboxypeptidase/D-alanyl-D-alanine-endopeptidase (penicillin-binding protein 4)
MLGPAPRLQTQVLGVGRLARGVWHGNLYLRGGGDPTFGDGSWNTFYEGGHGPTAAQLARALYKAGIRRVTGLLYADPSRFNAQLGGPATHYHADIPDYGGELSALVFDHGATGFGLGPAAFADHQVAVAMQNAGIGLQAARRTARTPLDARVLASVNSPPLRVLLRLMNVPSDDLFADLLTKQLGYQTLHEGTLAAGAEIIRQVLSIRYQLRPRMFDGSGLDKADRSSPDQIVSLLRQIWGTPVGAVLLRSLPTVGINGTVQTIADGTAAQGRCVAKTGTLNNVTNVAGYCAARSGQTLAFALMIDGPPNWVAVTPLGRMLAAIAGY